ncbi:MAG TPA: SDR family oxidoreductase [Microthrixaceae bacterium]|nr:SDR family oxidoreductase [Microthrixaceae bacterium]HNI33900.1 SDR family oxidoreductase [Microthrixaceae bacterium]
MSGICDGRVVIVTGAGRGLGRAHALAFAAEGAKVVVNDIGAEADGSGGSLTPAQEVVDEIMAAGGEAVVNGDDVSTVDGAERLVGMAIENFGDLHVVLNNAGIVRDRMFANATADEWDAVMQVHLKGHFLPAKFAAMYWRDRSKAGEAVSGRIINTSSGAGLMGSIAQAAYSAAKGGIASLTLVQAAELGRYGVTANALAPSARTRMTEEAFADMMAAPTDGSFDAMAAENVSPAVVWLGSEQSGHVTGRVFELEGGKITIAQGWMHGPSFDKGARLEPAEVGPIVDDLLREAAQPTPVYGT